MSGVEFDRAGVAAHAKNLATKVKGGLEVSFSTLRFLCMFFFLHCKDNTVIRVNTPGVYICFVPGIFNIFHILLENTIYVYLEAYVYLDSILRRWIYVYLYASCILLYFYIYT